MILYRFSDTLKLLLLFGILNIFLPKRVFSNAAQPGIWQAGGAFYSLLYAEDSSSFQKIQMQEEQIFIQLYRGFAAVKGVYTFKNTTNEAVRFRMGYPVNGIYEVVESNAQEIRIDSLSSFKVKVKGEWQTLMRDTIVEIENNGDNYPEKIRQMAKNWELWSMSFEKAEVQKVEVYFLVVTNEAAVSKGYARESYNSFIYLLESGSVWKQPIEKASFYIQLMDQLKLNSIHGLSSNFDFKFNPEYSILKGQKEQFSPNFDDNLIVTYSKKNEHFDFHSIHSKSEKYFSALDKLSSSDFSFLSFENVEIPEPFDLTSSDGGFFNMLLFFAAVFGPFILLGGFFLFIIIVLIKQYRRKRKKSESTF